MKKETSIKLFENSQVRTVWDEEQGKWWFSVQDVVEILTDTVDAKDYIKKMKKRDPELNSNWGTICPPVEMTAADGKPKKLMLARICNPCDHIIKQRTDCKSARAILFKNILV